MGSALSFGGCLELAKESPVSASALPLEAHVCSPDLLPG